jgi:transcriptional adapter 2-alpha
MPGRLEFDHEIDNDAEVPVKDMEFGLVWKFGGDEQPAAKVSVPVDAEEEEEEEEEDDDEDDEDEDEDGDGEGGADEKTKKKGKVKGKDKDKDRDKDTGKETGQEKDKEETAKEKEQVKDPKAKVKIAETPKEGDMEIDANDKEDVKPDVTGTDSKDDVQVNGSPKIDKKGKEKENVKDGEGEGEEAAEPPADEVEDEGELEVKLALLDIYFSKLDKREEAKELIFDRGLTEYKKVCRVAIDHPCNDAFNMTPGSMAHSADTSSGTTQTKGRTRAAQSVQGLCQTADGARL